MAESDSYKNGSFRHWLLMYDLHQKEWTADDIQKQVILYKSIEGEEAFVELQDEIKQIVKNTDLKLFLGAAKRGIALADLEFMANTLLITR